MNDINNDDVKRFPITKIGLHFHNRLDMLKYLTTGPEVRLSHGVQKVRCAAESSDKNLVESYHTPSALSLRVTVTFYAWRAAAWKAKGYLPFCYSDKFTKQ